MNKRRKQWKEKSVEYFDKLLKDETQINLSGKDLCHSDIKNLCQSLKKHKNITKLDLWNNKIGDIGAYHLSEYLKTNRTITHLDVAKNDIGIEGFKSMNRIFKTNYSIIVFHCYHNCLDTSDSECDDETEDVLVDLYTGLRNNIEGKKKRKFQAGDLLLLSRRFIKNSPFYEDNLPLDLFKIIFKLSGVF